MATLWEDLKREFSKTENHLAMIVTCIVCSIGIPYLFGSLTAWHFVMTGIGAAVWLSAVLLVRAVSARRKRRR